MAAARSLGAAAGLALFAGVELLGSVLDDRDGVLRRHHVISRLRVQQYAAADITVFEPTDVLDNLQSILLLDFKYVASILIQRSPEDFFLRVDNFHEMLCVWVQRRCVNDRLYPVFIHPQVFDKLLPVIAHVDKHGLIDFF